MLCTGYEILVLDLAGDGAVVAHVRFPSGEHAGGGMMLTQVAHDGRVAFADQAQRVWIIDPLREDRPTPVVDTGDTVTGLGIAANRLWVLTAAGRLSSYGSTR